MPRPKNPVPTLRQHKATKQAVTTVRLPNGQVKDLYLGNYGSERASTEYARIVAVVSANNGIYPVNTTCAGLTIAELSLAYIESHMQTGTPANKYAGGTDAKFTVCAVRTLFGSLPVVEFGPKQLKILRESLVKEGLSRKVVNGRIGAVKRIIKWGVSEDLIPIEVHQRLQTVEGLRTGQTLAPDREPVRPAVMADVEKTLPFLTPTVRALVIVQLHNGARAGELIKMRVRDIDRTDPHAWTYKPATHKGKGRTIYFGERCREALSPMLLKAGGPDAYVFNPRHAEAERLAEQAANRKTPRYASHLRRSEAKRVGEKRKRPPKERYTTVTYRRALERACERAGVPEFTPHRCGISRQLASVRSSASMRLALCSAIHSPASQRIIRTKSIRGWR